MSNEMVICIPGPWSDRSEFLRRVILLKPQGRYMFASNILLDNQAKEHVMLELYPHNPDMAQSFEIAGRGELAMQTLEQINAHQSVAYLTIPLNEVGGKEKTLKFTSLLKEIGGIAIKIETSGSAHEWDSWQSALSGNEFDLYCAIVVLVGDKSSYYSCGMHHFDLSECTVTSSVPIQEASDLMNHFNYWRIIEKPQLETGHTFSLSENSPIYELEWLKDTRYEPDDLFYNEFGLWQLVPR